MATNDVIASVEAEGAIIGGLLLDNAMFDEIATIVTADDFYLMQHKAFFEAVSYLLQMNVPVDILTLEQYLKDKKLMQELGGFAYLGQIVKNTPSAANIVAYAEIVARYSKQRKFLKLGQFIVGEMQSSKDQQQLEAFEENMDKQYTAITVEQLTDGVADLSDTFEAILKRMESASINADPVSGTPTGIIELDNVTTGGQAGDFIIIAARPSMGKTAFALSTAASVLDKYPNDPIQFYSQEMPAEQLLERLLAMQSRVSLQSIRRATELEDEEWARIAMAMEKINQQWNKRLLIDDEPSLSPHRLRSKVRRNTRLYGKPKAIFIDYIQLMRTTNKVENRNLELAEISGELKKLAKEMQCPVYGLAQLNRSVENRMNKRPINSDLRDSGSLEQDADVILHLYRDEVYNHQSEEVGIAEVIIGKQRNGPLATVKCRFEGQHSLFTNLID